jgi:hypothetical protein
MYLLRVITEEGNALTADILNFHPERLPEFL